MSARPSTRPATCRGPCLPAPQWPRSISPFCRRSGWACWGRTRSARTWRLALGPTFAPLFGSFAKSAAIGFMMFNMFHGTIQPLAGAARTLAQLAEDGLAPRLLARRLPTDAPWVATLLTAGFAILFLLIGDPIWLIAAANFTYLIGICLPSVAVWLLRRDAPDAARPYRAPRGTVGLGVAAAAVWGVQRPARIRAVRTADGRVRVADGVFRRRHLRIADAGGPAAAVACTGSAAACTQSSPARCCSCSASMRSATSWPSVPFRTAMRRSWSRWRTFSSPSRC